MRPAYDSKQKTVKEAAYEALRGNLSSQLCGHACTIGEDSAIVGDSRRIVGVNGHLVENVKWKTLPRGEGSVMPPAILLAQARAAYCGPAKFCKYLQIFASCWRARSRLYQSEISQENIHLTAFFKLYKICILLHRCNLNFFSKKSI